MGLLRTVKAELLKDYEQNFFTGYMILFNILPPFGVGLTYYFIYLPFPHDILEVQGFKISLLDFTIGGQLIYLLFINMVLIGTYFTRERLQGTLETIFLTPCNRFAVLLGGSLAGLVNYLWFILGLLTIMYVSGISPKVASLPALVLSVVLALFSTIVVGMLIQAFFVSSRRGSMWGTAVQEPMLFVSGIVFPMQYAPEFIRILSSAVPLSYSVLALRASVFAGATVSDLSRVFIFLALLSLFYLLVTVLGMKLIDKKLRREGTLQLF